MGMAGTTPHFFGSAARGDGFTLLSSTAFCTDTSFCVPVVRLAGVLDLLVEG